MKVSVILPVYQVEAYVKDCLDSVLGQTLKDLEIICIHDAGKDRSWDVVLSAAAGDERVRLFEHEQNRGLAATRNQGLSLARGKYVYFLDSDDKIRPDAMEILYERAEREQLDVQVFGASFIYEDRKLEEQFSSNPSGFKQSYPRVMDGKELFMAWMEVWDWLSSQPRYFYRRAFLEDHRIRFIEGMLHEDETFAFDVLMYAKRVRVWEDKLFIRRFRADSIMTGTPTIKNVEGCVKILEHVAAMQEIYRRQPRLNRAVKFYLYKLFLDAVRKYRRVCEAKEGGEGEAGEDGKGEGGEGQTMLQMLSDEIAGDPAKMAVFHLIEAFGLWGDG